MSIYIPGMEMPKSCISCPFMISRDNDDCILQSEEANESFENWEQMKAGCPLVEVPPHGRLIDADALNTRERGNNSQRIMWSNICQIVAEAATIIPSDEEASYDDRN